MKLLMGDARAFSTILCISVFVLFSSNLSVAKDTNLDPLPGQQDENFAQESVSDADQNPRGISDKRLEENAGEAPADPEWPEFPNPAWPPVTLAPGEPPVLPASVNVIGAGRERMAVSTLLRRPYTSSGPSTRNISKYTAKATNCG